MRSIYLISIASLIVLVAPLAALADTVIPAHQSVAVSASFSQTKIGASNGSTVPGRNRKGSSPVTEPDGLALLGVGLFSTAGLLRRKLTSRALLEVTPSVQAPPLSGHS